MIPLHLPAGARIHGGLYRPNAPIDVLEDEMLQVHFGPNTIEVGWFPEHDPNGQYRVRRYRERWDDCKDFFETKDPNEVSEYIREKVTGFMAGNAAIGADSWTAPISHSFALSAAI